MGLAEASTVPSYAFYGHLLNMDFVSSVQLYVLPTFLFFFSDFFFFHVDHFRNFY